MSNTSKHRILVVDDEPSIRRSMQWCWPRQDMTSALSERNSDPDICGMLRSEIMTSGVNFLSCKRASKPCSVSDRAGESGDAQGLSQIADAADESVEELADTNQTYEAEAVEGAEDAADHPEKLARIGEDYAQSDDISPAGEEAHDE